MSVVRTKREAAGLGQEELAKIAKISVFKLNRIERGRQPLQVEDAIDLARALKCDPIELLPQLQEASSLAQIATAPEEPAVHVG